MGKNALNDAAARATALDPSRSFIVQAPAGSGKTGLLIQRTLTLLARVEHPEEVLAITFTRKAAAEMRERLVDALLSVAQGEPEQDYERQTYHCAKAVIERDEALGWGLQLNPSRLRIMTIDALCGSLVAQMPVLSRFGGMLELVTQPQPLYVLAARRLLASLEDDSPVRDQLQVLLSHLDNDLPRVESLLVEMLRHRDRWLPLVAGQRRPDLTREALEETLRMCVESGLGDVAELLPDDVVESLVDLIPLAAAQCADNRPLRACETLDCLPTTKVADRELWEGIADFFLKQDGELRKRLTKSEGFPAPSATKDAAEKARRSEAKERASALFDRVGETPGLVAALAAIRTLPPAQYRNDEWRLLEALQTLLPVAAAQLKVLFAQRGQVDFTEQAHRALGALGPADSPTDLALALDYRIRHLLLDEFQDTSRTQFDLMECLVRGWEPGDGRTLFLVGDPMQSIYRFRDAEVGLFAQAQALGIGDVALESLTLSANFRTRADLVARNNEVFDRVFPRRGSQRDASVKFYPATGQRSNGGQLVAHAFVDETGEAEAQQVVACVREALARDEEGDVAILVRNRSHLRHILPRLARERLPYHAVDILPLRTSAVVVDLWSLTRALLHLGDRTAWLSVLRAPWCGLSLDDLFVLAGSNPRACILESMQGDRAELALSPEGRARLERIHDVLEQALCEKGRRGLRRWVEGTWTALGGPACVSSATDMENAATYFDLLENIEHSGGFDNLEDLARAVNELYAATRADSQTRLSIMTIHKAKGLEFDTVIVPGLDHTGRPDSRALLQWLELDDRSGQLHRLMAPINAPDAQDAIGDYVRGVQKKRDRSENQRLLYVAATRARETLHLMTRVKVDQDGEPKPPRAGSLASLLWPALGSDFEAAATGGGAQVESLQEPPTPTASALPSLQRLSVSWRPPSAPASEPWQGSDMFLPLETKERSDWGGDTARHVGTTVHRVLQQVATEGLEAWQEKWLDVLDDYLARMLTSLGVASGELDEASTRASHALRNTLGDERGRWVIAGHKDGRSEWPLSGWVEGRVRSVVLDRSFVDEEGCRWIIDYKTSRHETGTIDAFLDKEMQRYRPQLELYARVLRGVEPMPIRLGLYFPMFQGWREWSYGQDARN